MAWSASVTAIVPEEGGIPLTVHVTYADGTGRSVESYIQLVGESPLSDLKTRIRGELKRLAAGDAMTAILLAGPIDITLPPDPAPVQEELDRRAFQTAWQKLQAALRGVDAGLWSRTDPKIVALADDAKSKFKMEYITLL